jgi:membrane protease YdiL (CAAX protease family)
VPQYHPGAAYYPVFNRQYYEERQKHLFAKKTAEKKVRSISNLAGGNLLFSFLISNLFSLVFLMPFVSDLYDSSLSGVSIINIIYSVVTVAGGFIIYDIFFKNHAKKLAQSNGGVDCFDFKISFGAPKGALKTILLIFIGFGGCMIANYVSNIFLVFFEMFGFTSTYSAVEDPENIQDIILMCISTAIIPPLTEELAIRGLLMSRMRRYGNWFAIVTSAFIFGVFHGTVAQIPFAFVCGLFIGYAVIATESIWTGVFIHALNNGISCLCSILIEYVGEETANIIWTFISYGGLGLGLICFIIYYNKYKKKKTDTTGFQKVVELSKSSVTAPLYDGVSEYQGDAFELTQKQKIGVFLKTPTVIVGTVLYLLISLASMEFA